MNIYLILTGDPGVGKSRVQDEVAKFLVEKGIDSSYEVLKKKDLKCETFEHVLKLKMPKGRNTLL